MLSLVLGVGGGVKSESDKDFQHRIVSKLVKKLLFSLQLIKEHTWAKRSTMHFTPYLRQSIVMKLGFAAKREKSFCEILL